MSQPLTAAVLFMCAIIICFSSIGCTQAERAKSSKRSSSAPQVNRNPADILSTEQLSEQRASREDEMRAFRERSSKSFDRLRGTDSSGARRVFDSLHDVLPYLSYRPLSPTSTAAGTVTAIFLAESSVTPDSLPAPRSIMFVLGDPEEGAFIEARPYKDASDYDFEQRVKFSQESIKDRESCEDCSQGENLVHIHGVPGSSEEAFYEVGSLGPPEPTNYVSASVRWWEKGVLYTIHGTRGEDATPASVLVEVAQSMK